MGNEQGYFGITCKIKGDKVFRDNAKLYVNLPLSGMGEKFMAVGLSRGGRKVLKWVAIKRCFNFKKSWFERPERMKHAPFPFFQETFERFLSRSKPKERGEK